jgi:hypothetical protein
MKYFNQILDKYNSLHEQYHEDPEAVASANKLITSVKSSGNPAPIKGNITLQRTETGGISIFGLGAFPITVIEDTGQTNEKGFKKLVGLLSKYSDFIYDGPRQELLLGQQPDQGQPLGKGGAKFPYFPNAYVANPKKVKNTLEKICKDEVDKINSNDELNKKQKTEAIRKSNQSCSKLINETDRLVNDNRGSIAQTLDASQRLLFGCEEDNIEQCETKQEDTAKSIEHRNSAFYVIQDAMNTLTDAQRRENKMLTLEECASLKKSISITGGKMGGKSRTLAITGPDGNGMVVFQERTTFLADALTTLAKGVKCPDGSPFEYDSNTVEFLTSNGVGQSTGSTLKGFFFEDLRAAISTLKDCQAAGRPQGECDREASQHLLRWLKTKDNLLDAMRDLLARIKESGELAVELDDERGISFINDFLGRISGDLEVSEEMLATFNIMARTAALGVSERSPAKVEKTGNITGGGKKADMTEHYRTPEEAEAAADKMKLSPEQRKYIKVRKVTKAGITTYVLGDSVKFSSDVEKIYAGQAARSNIKDAIGNPRESKDWFDAMHEVGITSKDITAVGSSIKEFESNLETLLNLEEVEQYKTKDGKRIAVNQRAQAAEEITRAITEQLGVDSQISQSMIGDLKKLIEQEKPWEEISGFIADKIYKAKLESGLMSDNPQAALNQIATFGAFGGISSDGCFLSAADGPKGRMHTSAQNYHIERMKKRLDAIGKLPVEQRSKFVEMNSKSINIKDDSDPPKTIFTVILDQMNVDTVFDGEDVVKHSKVTSIKQGEQPKNLKNINTQEQPENASTIINRDQLMKFLVEQKTTLDRMIHIIARDGLN